uniref:NADH dehydrogenase subunit 2 n=1 Tax=Caprella acanthogaster TaxID=380745 RepID=UPI0023D89CD0|nr:NADH dehydrogenase subunit 2 [Caprella acanthogaster]WCR50886.1 NADH dehydrogenase subunit 2 [Caprella acanthogaster]
MFLHPSSFLFLTLLVATIFMIVSADSWLMMWIFFEVNLLLFIPLLFSKKSKYQSEASLKYFLNQAMSSVFILSSVTFLNASEPLCYYLLCTAFSLKMGVAPLHGWLITISSSISWLSLWLLLIPQKIAPMLIMSMLIKKDYFLLVCVFIVLSALLGAWGGLTTPSMKKIITYSSIAQMGWLLTSLLSSTITWITYFIVYSLITTSITLSLSFMKANKINDLLSSKNKLMKTLMMVNMLATAGLPPFSGFMMKLTLVMKTIEVSKSFLLLPLILSSLASLYFYTRVFYMSLMDTAASKTNNKKIFFEKIIIFFNIFSLPVGLLLIY